MLRIVRCTARRDGAPEVDGYVVRQAAGLRATPGNLDAIVGRRQVGDVVHYAFVSAWAGFDAMQRALGRDLNEAPLLGPVVDRVTGTTIEHFERMDLPAGGSGGRASVLRFYGGPIPHRQAEAYYAQIRGDAWERIRREDAFVTGHVGRRLATEVDHVALVTAWQSWEGLIAAFPDAEQRPLVAHEDERVVTDMRIEHYDVLSGPGDT